MNTKQRDYDYSPSVNIIRDKGKNLNYIPTLNGQHAIEHIVQVAAQGIRAFSVVGAYGTGKSSFLWAIAASIQDSKGYFGQYDYLIKGYSHYQWMDIVGEYTSIIQSICTSLGCDEDTLFDALGAKLAELQAQKTALIIRIDEFGKFLEYAAKHDAHKELYFLQQLAEYVNDTSKNVMILTTLHQDFSAYAYTLAESERKEWTKVKGRFREITFNEPPEQLLLVAANRLAQQAYKADKKQLKNLLQAAEKADAFALKDYFSLEIAQQLAPMELLAGSALTLALQRYGQNERSFFSFIEAHDYHGLQQFIKEPTAPCYHLGHIYDYLIYHYYSHLTSKYCEDYRAWRLMRDSIERAEGIFEQDFPLATQLIKITGLLNLFGKPASRIDDAFLQAYAKNALSVDGIATVMDKLIERKIIHYRKHSQRYVLSEGTDVDIDLAIDDAGMLVEQLSDISGHLSTYFHFPVIQAKRYQVEVGTPRFFEFRLSNEPIQDIAVAERDGYINLVFSHEWDDRRVEAFSATVDEPILFCYFKQTQQIREQILLIEKVKRAKVAHVGDRIAQFEFDDILMHHQNLLRYLVIDKFFMADPTDISFFYRGAQVFEINNRRSLNNFLSQIAGDAYPSTPRYFNEMVNKTKLSAAISTARRNLVKNLIEYGEQEDIGYPAHLFPPDKMIYLSLLKDKGFHREEEGRWVWGAPQDETFQAVWQCYENFLVSARHSKRSLQDLADQLLQPPFKLKKGLVDILLPVFLLIKKDELSLYYQQNDRFIPDISGDTLDLVVRKPGDYSIKTFSVEGIRLSVFNQYRELLNQAEAERISSQGFVDTIVPFLSFYRDLPEYAKRTKKITNEAQRLREAILKATDPEKSFFEDFPQALGYSLGELHEDAGKLQTYFERLRSAIKEIQFSYDALLDRYETFLKAEIMASTTLDFEGWRSSLQQRFVSVKPYVVAPYLKTFLQRIHAPLDDKRAWLSSVAQVVLGKSMEQIQDEEEPILYSKFEEWVRELDNYTDITQATQGTGIEEALRVEVTNLQGGKQMKVVKVPKGKGKQISAVEKKVGNALTDDKNLNIFILSKMLNELLK